jgi:Lar family restriction alleviation protein
VRHSRRGVKNNVRALADIQFAEVAEAMGKVLLPCPFCAGMATLTADGARVGTARQSCIVVCTHCGARLETAEAGARSGDAWNARAGYRLIKDT